MRGVNIGSTGKPNPKYSVNYLKMELQLRLFLLKIRLFNRYETSIFSMTILAEGFALSADNY